MEKDYRGGLLLIDEIETTLYPAAQYQLMNLLLKASADYELQVVFTTHSTEIISYMLNPTERSFYYSSEIIYLHNPRGTIEFIQDKNQIDGIVANLRHTVTAKSKKTKTNVYSEDEEARVFLKGIIPQEIKSGLEIKAFNHGADAYKSLLDEKFPEFKRSLIILDGDKSKDTGLKKHKNVIFLPGVSRPENILLEYLDGLPPQDDFWESRLGGYDKQVFLMNKPTNTTDRVVMKQWFNGEKQYWGNGCNKLFSRWKQDNQVAVEIFNKALKKKVEKAKSL